MNKIMRFFGEMHDRVCQLIANYFFYKWVSDKNEEHLNQYWTWTERKHKRNNAARLKETK
jgi:hypothetical protein